MTETEATILKNLDAVVMSGNTGVITTQYGDVRVHPTRFHGYAAEIVDNGRTVVEFAETPSRAFWKLGGTVKAMNN